MRALKVLVIVMGVLIVAGTAVVIVTVAKRVSQSGRAAPASVAASLTLPAGCKIAEMTTIADRLALRLEGEGDCGQILLVDPATAAITGHIGLVPAK